MRFSESNIQDRKHAKAMCYRPGADFKIRRERDRGPDKQSRKPGRDIRPFQGVPRTKRIQMADANIRIRRDDKKMILYKKQPTPELFFIMQMI